MKKTCEICHGSGQTCSFNGVSRFLLSWEECPACGGFGFELPAQPASSVPDQAAAQKPATSTKHRERQ